MTVNIGRWTCASVPRGKSFAGCGDADEYAVMILDLWLLFGIKPKIMTDDLVPQEAG